MIVDHTDPDYAARRLNSRDNMYNGAYYYSKEIVDNIIPNVDTDRNWVTVNQPGKCFDHSIVFIHNNLNIDKYEWLSDYDDLILVCGVPQTVSKIQHLHKTIYLPLSVDVGYVLSRGKGVSKNRGTAYFGRPTKARHYEFPPFVDVIGGLERHNMLKLMASYRYVYAVGRTAIEANILGCKVLQYDPRYPDPSLWKIVDNVEAAAMLQQKLDRIDG